MGTGGDGPLTPRGRELLREFQRLGLVLDLVHTADTALEQALDIYEGPAFISHGNCRALVDHDRTFVKWAVYSKFVNATCTKSTLTMTSYLRLL